MKNMNLRNAFVAFFAAGLFSMAPVSAAYNNCDPCSNSCGDCCPDWCGGFDIGADFLYWKPCISNLDYAFLNSAAVASDTSTSGHYKYIDPCWEPGVRGYISKKDVWCDWMLMGSYTYIHSTESARTNTTTVNALSSTLLHRGVAATQATQPVYAKGTHKLQYHSFDILLAKEYCPCPCQTLTPFFGVEYVYTDHMINSKIYDSASTPNYNATRWDSDFWGVGLKMGSMYNYEICDCFGLFAKASGTLLTGSHCDTNHQRELVGTETSVTFKDDECLCVPGWHIAVGLTYTDCYCGWDFQARLGYEFLQWYGMPNPRRFFGADTTNALAQSSSPTTTNVGFHGLLAGFSVSF